MLNFGLIIMFSLVCGHLNMRNIMFLLALNGSRSRLDLERNLY